MEYSTSLQNIQCGFMQMILIYSSKSNPQLSAHPYSKGILKTNNEIVGIYGVEISILGIVKTRVSTK